jgi:hypothetical protein
VSNVGQAVLTIGGAVVGSFFGAPQLGYLLGSFAGSALFPTKLPTVRGPKLEDAKVQSSALGAPIPWVWGTFILAGQMIWRSPFLERKVKEKSGGKGGPEQTSIHYEYRINVAIGLCKGPIVGIRRIWADTKLIYDASGYDPGETPPSDFGDGLFGDFAQRFLAQQATSQFNASKFDLYLGDESQTADATIETWEGVGNVSGYRGLAYIVFRDFELADYGNRIPNFRVEVMTAGTVSDTSVDLYANDVLYPWQFQSVPDAFDPRNPLNQHEYAYQEGGTMAFNTFEYAMADMNSATDHPTVPFLAGETPQQGDSLYIHGWNPGSATPNYVEPCDKFHAYSDYVEVAISLNALPISGDRCSYEVGGNTCTDWWNFLGAKGNVVYVSSGQFSGYYVAVDLGADPDSYFGGIPTTSIDSDLTYNNCSVAGNTFDLWALYSHEMSVTRKLAPPDTCYGNFAIPGTDDYCATPEGLIVPSITWTYTAGTWRVLQKYTTTSNFVTKYPLSPARPSTHAEYNDQDFWEAAYATAVANGDMPSGLTYGVDYPESQSYGYVGTLGGTLADPDPIPLSTIVADICEGCGLTEYDVDDLSTIMVHGYALTSPMTGRDGIDPLRPFGYFDAVESEFVYKFVTRGQASVATIDTDDLAAHMSGEERPPSISVTRAQDQELPRMVRGHFIDITRDGDPGQAEQQRQTVDSVNIADLQVPVVMPVERGQAMVDTVLFERWIGRNTYQCALPFKYAALEPTDCIDILIDGTVERMRVTESDLRGLSIIDVTAIRDDLSIYSGTDIVGTNSGGTTIPIGSVPSPTEMVLLDLPALRSQDTDCGYYAAARGVLEGWPGAIVYRATSASGAFRQVAWTSVAATIGYVTDRVDIVSDSGNTDTGTSAITGGIDQSTVLRVTLNSGDFSSVTEADLIAGENMIAVGTEGDWELIRFQLAVLGTDGVWELSGLLREQIGTARREIDEGDLVVLMTGPGIMRIEETDAALGVSRVLRAVTSGTSLEDAEDHEIATACLSRPAAGSGSDPFVSVINRTEATTPASPSCGDTYIVPSSPAATGAWTGQEGNLARYSCTTLSWEFTAPTTGAQLYVEAEDDFVYWSGTEFELIESAESAAFMDLLADGVQGDILYRGASDWERLAAGISGRFLRTSGAGADPQWTGVLSGGGGFASSVQESDLVITSNAVFQDTDVSIALEPGTYAFESFYEAIVNSTPGMTVRITFDGTETQFAAIRSFARGTTVGTEQVDAQPYDVSYGVTAAGVTTTTGVIVVTVAGSLKIQAKQNSSSPTSVTFSKGNWLRVSQLA